MELGVLWWTNALNSALPPHPLVQTAQNKRERRKKEREREKEKKELLK